MLAEPVLVTTTDKMASFSTGQMSPVTRLIPRGEGYLEVEGKGSGMQIDVLPTLSDSGLVRLQVHARICAREDGIVMVGDHAVLRLQDGKIDVTVMLYLGQTLMFGGLAPTHVGPTDRLANTADGQIEQDIVVVVTPTLLKATESPVAPGDEAEATAPRVDRIHPL